jgi:hypothetical protein
LQLTTDDCQGIACVLVDLHAGKKILNYMVAATSFAYLSGKNVPMMVAKIDPASTRIGKEILAPKVASFSSRGPSPDYPDIIKV